MASRSSGEIPNTTSGLPFEVKDYVSKKIDQSAKRLGRKLGLCEEDISVLERDHARDWYEFCYQILRKWECKQGNSAVVSQLIAALKAVDRQDIAEGISGLVSGSGISPPEQLTRNSQDSEAFLEKAKAVLLEYYEDIGLPQPPWMDLKLDIDELYVDLEMFTVDKHGNEDAGNAVSLDKIFQRGKQDKEHLRILIEGGPGFGKTTLTCKLVKDWVKGEDYLSKFRLVFLMVLRCLKEAENFDDAVTKYCQSMLGMSNGQKFLECIKKYEDTILLIFDGYDELSEKMKSKIDPILQKKLFKSATVVVTSRRGIFKLDRTTKNLDAFGVLGECKKDQTTFVFWSKRIMIRGVAEPNRRLFLQKYFKNDYTLASIIIIKLVLIEDGTGLYECPLFLMLLAFLAEKESLDTLNSKTSLYKAIFSFVIKRSLVRIKKIGHEEELDIFQPEDNNLAFVCQKLVSEVGKIAQRHLINDNLFFSVNEIKKASKKCGDENLLSTLGLFTKVLKLPNRKHSEFYQPVHKSFLEFATAFHLWLLSDENQEDLPSADNKFKQSVEYLLENGLTPVNDTFIYLFLGGLMGKDVDYLLSVLSPWAHLFDVSNILVKNIFLETRFLTKVTSVRPFVPQRYFIDDIPDFYELDVHKRLFNDAAQRALISELHWEPVSSLHLEKALKLRRMFLYVGNRFFQKDISDMTLIECNELVCGFKNDFDSGVWDSLVKLVSVVKTKKISFAVPTFNENDHNYEPTLSILKNIHSEMTTGSWNQLQIHRLVISFSSMTEKDLIIAMQWLLHLLKQNRIRKGLSLKFQGEVQLKLESPLHRLVELVVTAALSSECLTALSFSNWSVQMNVCVDVSRLNTLSDKSLQWSSLGFIGPCSFTTMYEANKSSFYVQNLCWDTSDPMILKDFYGVRLFSCMSTNLPSLLAINWSCWQTISELHIYVMESSSEWVAKISQVKSITALTISFQSAQKLKKIFFRRLSDSLFELNLHSFGILNVADGEPLSKITRTLVNVCKLKRNQNLTTLNTFTVGAIANLTCDELKNSLTPTKTMLVNKELGEFALFNPLDNHVPALSALFPVQENFRYYREIDGSNTTQPLINQQNRKMFLGSHDRIVVKYSSKGG